jgi:hypothetical protein
MVIGVRDRDVMEEVFIRVPDPRFHPNRWPWVGLHSTEPPRPGPPHHQGAITPGAPTCEPHPANEALERHADEILREFMEVAGEMIDPAILVDAREGEIYLVEHIELIAAMHDSEMDEQPPPHEPGLIVVAVLDGPDLYRRQVPDPRVHRDEWPWPSLPF